MIKTINLQKIFKTEEVETWALNNVSIEVKQGEFVAIILGKYMVNNDYYFAANPYNFAGYNQSKDVLNEWKEPGDITDIPAYGNVMQFDTHLLENASFLRLKNISLSYILPKNWLL